MSERLSPSAESAAKPGENEDRLPGGTGFVFHEKYLDHTLGKGHPESPERLQAILRRMKASGLDRLVKNIRPSGDPLPFIKAIHPEAHIRRVAERAHDESICRLAVAGALAAVDAVCRGQVMNAFCALRPPGHHAADAGENGYCFYNNVAIAARYAQHRNLAEKVLIVDWDLHHGNGTQHTFESDPTTLYFSSHQFPYYPGTGRPDEVGKGKGKGYTVNVPLPGGQGDGDFIRIYQEILEPIANQFQPDLVLVSAGFDTYYRDPLGGMGVTEEGYAEITHILMRIADACCQGRIVLTLEGGYDLNGLASSVKRVIQVLQGTAPAASSSSPASSTTERIVEHIRDTQKAYWRL